MADSPTRLDIAELDSDRELALTGEVDAFTADTLRTRLEELGTGGDVALSMAGVTFIDSSGLRALIGAHQALEAAGHRLELRQPSDPVVRLLEIVGLTDHLHIART